MKEFIKIQLLGDAKVGKTALLQRYGNRVFSESYIQTIGISFKVCTINLEENTYSLQIIDETGDEKFRCGKYDSKEMGASLIVFDASNKASFNELQNWLYKVKTTASAISVFLVSSKIDLDRQVSVNEVQNFIMSWNNNPENENYKIIDYVETSAKTNINIDFLFEKVTAEVVRRLNLAPASKLILPLVIEMKPAIPVQTMPTKQRQMNSSVNMQLLGAFIFLMGCLLVAIAFLALQAATFGVTGIITAAVGSTISIAGVGFFVRGCVSWQTNQEEPINSPQL